MRKFLRLSISFIIPIIIIFSFISFHNLKVKYNEEIKECKIQIKQQEKTIEVLNEEKENLITENDNLKTQIEEKDKEISTLKKDKSKLQTEINNLKKKLNSSSSSTITKASGDKATYQEYAHNLVINEYKWSESDFDALVNL